MKWPKITQISQICPGCKAADPGQLRSSLTKFEWLPISQQIVCLWLQYEILCAISHGKKKSNHALIVADLTSPEILWKDNLDEVIYYNFLSWIKGIPT